jgi:hypothetical protein
MKTLQIFNGRGRRYWAKDRSRTIRTEHVYICAWSKADAVRVMHEAGFERFTLSELNVYYAKGCWGDAMEGVKHERGVWATPHRRGMEKPYRIL